MSTSRLLPPLAVLGSVTSLQFGAALASKLFVQVGPAGASALRLAISALILLVITRPRVASWSRAQWKSVLVYGVVLGGMNGAFYEAVGRIPLGAAVTIEFLGPLALATALSRRRRDLLWVGLALSGVVLLGLRGFGGGLALVGVAWALLAATFWACYILAGSRLAGHDVGFRGLAVASAIAALLSLPGGLISGGTALIGASVLPLALGMAVLASVIPYALELFALGRLPKKTFSVLLALEPAVAALVGALLLGQALNPISGLAVALVIAAGVGATLTSAPRAEELPPLAAPAEVKPLQPVAS